jgi:hypothetical protein
MTRPVLTFDRHGLTGETARLGERVVGHIVTTPGRQQRAAWTVTLTDWPQLTGPATSFDVARKKITGQVEEWCASVGWIDPGAGVDVRVLTNEEETSRT